MATYRISDPQCRGRDRRRLRSVTDAAHAVVQQAMAAGVWVFGRGIDEGIPPVRVDADGTVTGGTYPQTALLEGGYTR